MKHTCQKLFMHFVCILSGVVFIACTQQNEPNSQSKSLADAIKGLRTSAYNELLNPDREVFGRCVFTDMHLFLDTIADSFYSRTNDPYVLALEKDSFMVTDSCFMSNAGTKTSLVLNRYIVEKSSGKSISFPYELTLKNDDPILFTKPYPTKCDPTPLCYYKDMLVEWNEDPENSNGVVIMIEWLGSTAFESPADTSLVRGIVVEDNGAVVLDNDLFDGIPHYALVNMYLMRVNEIAQFATNTDDAVAKVAQELKTNYPNAEGLSEGYTSLLKQKHNPLGINGSVALLPIVLVREI